jgi:multimeric flavodoxin WrbA
MPKILAVAGSPRPGGNTDVMLAAFKKGAEAAGAEVEVLRAADLHISPCTHCDGCQETGECVIDDDMEKVYKKLKEADGLVMASPIYFGAVSAPIKAVIERFQVYWFINFGNKNLRHLRAATKRPASFLAVGGMKNKKYCESVYTTAEALFLNTRLAFSSFLCLQGYDERGALEKDPEALRAAYQEGWDYVSNHF